MQEKSRRGRKTLRVVYEEIKKLRMELVQEANRQEQKSCAVSGESGRSANPRTTITMLEKGNRFETNGWSIERRNDGEKETTKDDMKMSDGAWTDWMALCHRELASVDIASNIRVGRCC